MRLSLVPCLTSCCKEDRCTAVQMRPLLPFVLPCRLWKLVMRYLGGRGRQQSRPARPVRTRAALTPKLFCPPFPCHAWPLPSVAGWSKSCPKQQLSFKTTKQHFCTDEHRRCPHVPSDPRRLYLAHGRCCRPKPPDADLTVGYPASVVEMH